MKDHPDEEVQRAAADPNAGGVELKDDLGHEIPGEVWHTAMRYTGLAAAREIVRLRDELEAARVEVLTLANELADVMPSDDLKPALDTMAKALDAKTREADELRAQRDRAEALCQEHATIIKQLEERLRQAMQRISPIEQGDAK